jgi:molybdate-binding protein/DNA-binding XRE family transcriptional regulator
VKIQRDPSLSKVKALRLERGFSAAELAAAVGMSRQTVHAIENGSFVPNTLVALKLAKCLSVSVEELFSLPEDAVSTRVPAERLSIEGRSSGKDQLVRLADAPTGKLAIPVSAVFSFLPRADGVNVGRSVIPFASTSKAKSSSQLLLAGCDPALSLLADMAARQGVELILIPASSRQALHLLWQKKIHIAGCHLLDTKTRQFNLPDVRRRFPKGAPRVVTFASWQTGLVSAPNTRRKLRSVADLASARVRFVNREKGSGCRAQFDLALKAAGLPSSSVSGYHHIAYGHLSAAQNVANGSADCCFANLAAARCYGLAFEPLQTERFDLIIPQPVMQMQSAQKIANLLASAVFRNTLATFAGYDTSCTGELLTLK